VCQCVFWSRYTPQTAQACQDACQTQASRRVSVSEFRPEIRDAPWQTDRPRSVKNHLRLINQKFPVICYTYLTQTSKHWLGSVVLSETPLAQRLISALPCGCQPHQITCANFRTQYFAQRLMRGTNLQDSPPRDLETSATSYPSSSSCSLLSSQVLAGPGALS